MIYLAMILAQPRCPIPKAAYAIERNLTAQEIRRIDAYAVCKCGPDGAVDYDPRPTREGYRFEASCSSFGWNGHRYVGSKR